MDSRLRFVAPFVAAFLVLFATIASAAPTILFPPPRSALTTAIASVMGKAPPNSIITWQHFLSSGVIQKDIPVNTDGVFYLTAELEPGVNRLTIDGAYFEIYYDDGSQPMPQGYFKRTVHAGDISMCEDCHDKFSGKLQENGYPGVCTNCHVVVSQNPNNQQDPMSYPHFRSVQSGCGTCHEPHYSDDPKLVLATAKKPCSQCHSAQQKGETNHPAFEEGGCAACHDTHYSGFAKNLYSPLPKVCHQCHSEADDTTASTFHPPDASANDKWCSACHNPHALTDKLLKNPVSSLCTGCHSKIVQEGHGDELSSCTDCHNPHRPVGSGLLVKDFKGCLECHDEYAEAENPHAPVEDGCQNCHNPHSDDNVKLAGEKCLTCHDFKKDRDTASLHGNLPLTLSDCLMCHNVHGSKEPKLAKAKTHFPLTQGKCDACHGATPARKITDENKACAKCHNVVRDLDAKKARIHDPVTDEGCTACHDPHMSKERRYLSQPMESLCRECHDIPRDGEEGLVAHPAAETCTDCHGPHGGERAKFLSSSVPTLCFDCHDNPAEEKPVVHDALEEGCTACHDPHAGTGKSLLRGGGAPDLCYECHSDPTADKKDIHPALDEGCTACHNPHASENKKLLNTGGNDLCLECHDNPGEGGEPHPALDEGCTACHDPHATNQRKLVKVAGNGVCFECHDDPADGMQTIHPALDEGCTSCHNPHTSKKGPLLDRPANEICRDCHDSLGKDHHALDASIAKDYPGPKPFPVIGKELSCVGCHSPHASAEGKLFAQPEATLCSSCH